MKPIKVLIIDVGCGNLLSMKKALLEVLQGIGFEPTILCSGLASDVPGADVIVMPGVGAFSYFVNSVRESAGLLSAVEKHIFSDKKLFIGVCVGMQAMFKDGYEPIGIGHATADESQASTLGFGWFEGAVRKLPCKVTPHVGWNGVFLNQKNSYFQAFNTVDSFDFYFTHSYYVDLPSGDDQTDFGLLCSAVYDAHEFCAAFSSSNVFATQFHPEKSHDAGRAFLECCLASLK